MNTTTYYLISGLLIGAFIAGMMTWRGCAKQEVRTEVKRDTTVVTVRDTIPVEVTKYVTRTKVERDTVYYQRVQAAVDTEVAEISEETHGDVQDVAVEGSFRTEDAELTIAYYLKGAFFELRNLTVYPKTITNTIEPPGGWLNGIYKYGFWALLAALGATLVISLNQ